MKRIIVMYEDKDRELNMSLYDFIEWKYRNAEAIMVCNVTKEEYNNKNTRTLNLNVLVFLLLNCFKQMFKNKLTFSIIPYIIKLKFGEAECGCHLHRMEVVHMIENLYLQLIFLLFSALVAVTIIAFTLIIVLSIMLSK